MNARHRSTARGLVVLMVAALTAACTEPEDMELTGVWAGTNELVTTQLTLRDTGTRITGSGHLNANGEAHAVTVSGGLRVERDVSLTLTGGADDPSFNFQGEFVDRATVEGRLNGWIFHDVPLTLRKQ